MSKGLHSPRRNISRVTTRRPQGHRLERYSCRSFGGGPDVGRGDCAGVIRHPRGQQRAKELAMSTAISWVFEAAIKPDGVDDYRALGREITADNEATEPGQMI